jgi:hypothetical protein
VKYSLAAEDLSFALTSSAVQFHHSVGTETLGFGEWR